MQKDQESVIIQKSRDCVIKYGTNFPELELHVLGK